MSSLFTHRIEGSPWIIVIQEGGSHFYFNSSTRHSVWQASDTGLLSEHWHNLNYDALAVKFAQSRGWTVGNGSNSGQGRAAVQKPTAIVPAPSNQPADELGHVTSATPLPSTSGSPLRPQSVGQEPDTESESRLPAPALADSSSVVRANSETPTESSPRAAHGLALGYSSDEGDSGDSGDSGDHVKLQKLGALGENSDSSAFSQLEHLPRNDDGIADAVSHLSGPDRNASDGGLSESELDALLDGDDETGNAGLAKQDFRDLLDRLAQQISPFDPWFLAEEQLMDLLAGEPAYYALSSGERAAIYDGWTAERDQTLPDLEPLYPTATLEYLHFLDGHKRQVRDLYYPEFCTQHPEAARHDSVDREELYRSLRVALNDQAARERADKPRRKMGPAYNAKVEHVTRFLESAAHDGRLGTPPREGGVDGTAYEQWIALLNSASVPPETAHDPTNFILGDDKRVIVYRRVMSSGAGKQAPPGVAGDNLVRIGTRVEP